MDGSGFSFVNKEFDTNGSVWSESQSAAISVRVIALATGNMLS